jgi:excisionase family DNA binding protein
MKIDGKTIKEWREWLSAKEAAQYTGLGFSTLAKLRLKGGSAPYAKVGSKVVYRKADLDAWLESKRVANTSQYAS